LGGRPAGVVPVRVPCAQTFTPLIHQVVDAL